jgi:copper ion binding protein
MTTTLEVAGMTCQGCVQNVRGLLERQDGVSHVDVTLEPGRAVVDHEAQVAADALVKAIEAAGYEARVAA